MTQRNFMNDRYNDESRTGKTRKSSASVKPKTARAATVRDPAPKTKKQKKEEARERERQAAEKASYLQSSFEDTESYKKLRRIWWILLAGAILCTVLSFAFARDESLNAFSMGVMVLAYVLIIAAFYIDLGKIRKERKLYNASLANNKSKEARREQKRMRAEKREQEREAAEKYEAAKAEEDAKKAEGGFLARFRKKKPEGKGTESAKDGAEGAGKADGEGDAEEAKEADEK